MILTNLKYLHKDILKNNMTFDVFDYNHNNIEFSVLFDINPNTNYKLVFIKKKSDLYFTLDIKNNYYLNTYLGEKLSILRKMLELGNGKIEFSTNQFFEKFNLKIPSEVSKKNLAKSTISRIYKCEEADKTHIKKIHNWDKYPRDNRNVTPENREKTRMLYPEIYEKIKDKNISVFYTKPEDKNIS